ncbi:hypothetical protein [Ferrimonas balearica]|uniref:hypothetical protein n=1 Tax=Ferrimonas balearica TaxID=44012 RepID=UPI001C994278|nr:hypothetical protein [Ferrimonas balearica]MBY5921531.1 hypothetical protein [Ferrimonas balearica]MBY5995784.1 hypothetical protein [Ferrimonas balearica]
MRPNKLLLSVIALCLSGQAYALSKGDFDNIEYAIGADTGKTLPYATDTLTDSFKQTYDFIEWDDEVSEKLVTYLDTQDRALKAHSVSIRVREHVTKPKKSKITVKLRAADPSGFGELSGYTKAEIDHINGQDKYSVSYDIPFSPADINVKEVDIVTVIAHIQRDPNAWAVVKDLMTTHQETLQQTVVMRTYEWEGDVANSQYGNAEVEFQVWTPYYRRPRMSLAEISFKGQTSDRSSLDALYQHLKTEVQATGLSDGHVGSKTNATYSISSNFN